MIGATTLGVIAWPKDAQGAAIARTIGLTTFSLANVYHAIAARDELRTMLSLDTFADRCFLAMTGLSLVAIVLGAQLGVLNRILQTVSLNFRE